jgi:uncharacterized protein DUF1003
VADRILGHPHDGVTMFNQLYNSSSDGRLGGSAEGQHGFDPYPYILLNLMLSMVAGLQGAIVLIAAKRFDQVSSELAMHTYDNMNQLTELLTRVDDLTRQIHEHICVSGHPVSARQTS